MLYIDLLIIRISKWKSISIQEKLDDNFQVSIWKLISHKAKLDDGFQVRAHKSRLIHDKLGLILAKNRHFTQMAVSYIAAHFEVDFSDRETRTLFLAWVAAN